MKNKLKLLPVLLLVLALTLSTAACGQDETVPTTMATTAPSTTQTPTTTPTTTETTVPTTTATTVAPTPVTANGELPAAAAGENILTGLPLADAARQNVRPIAIMINNIKIATPQLGINKADLYYEMVVEGGITRMMMVFADPATVPEIGSIRSARHNYIDLAGGHDAIYVHVGSSYAANEQIARQKTDDIDMMSSGSAFWRDPAWARDRGREHSVRTTGDRLVKAIASRKYRATLEGTPLSAFNFLAEAAPAADPTANAAKEISVRFSNYTTARFVYDEATKLYTKHQFGKPQIDLADNKGLSTTNVLVLQTTITSFEGTSLRDIDLSEGTGYYASLGGYKKLKWKKGDTKDPILLQNEDDSPLQINRGKTFIAIQDKSSSLSFG